MKDDEFITEEFSEDDSSEKSKGTGKKAKEKVNFALDLPGVIDVLEINGKLQYLTENFELIDAIEISGKTYSPPPKDTCPYLFAQSDYVLPYIKLHTKDQCGEDDKLYLDLFNYHTEISDLPQEDFYHLLVLWDFHTYLLDKLHFSPVIYFYAVKERGKSRTTKGMLYVSRRGIFTETVREPDIIRWGNDHKAALGFDVSNFPKKIERGNCDDLILARFEKGSTASRTLYPEKGAFRDTKTFQLFGATIIATNRPVNDILESRSISIDMKPSNKLFSNPVLPETAQDLKNRLTAFRIAHYSQSLMVDEKPAAGRLGDIISPLYQIILTYFPKQKNIFIQMLKKIEMQKKDDAIDTLEAKILEIVILKRDEVNNGFLATSSVTNKFNEGKEVRFTFTPDTVGKMLRGLGFIKKPNSRERGIYYDEDLIKKLSTQYGLNEENTSICETASHESQESSKQEKNDADDTCDVE